MEYTAPHNRIVIGYEFEELRVLGIRSRIDGSYVKYEDVDADVFPTILNHWVNLYKDIEDPVQFIADLPESKDNIEGVVVRLASGQRVKVKTTQYLQLHKNKDNVNSPKKLFSAVVYETSDDLRSLFNDDLIVLGIIQEMEDHVSKQFNHIVNTTERFYMQNKNLERKEFAILGQQKLPRELFSLAMNLYLGKETDYKQFMIKHYENYKLPGSTEPQPV